MVDPTVELEATKAALKALQPLDQDQASRALRWLGEILGVPAQTTPGITDASPPITLASGVSAPPHHAAPGSHTPPASNDPTTSPEEFIAWKRPRGSAERIACLGFYLSEYRDTRHFKTPDISALNTEAAQSKFGNPRRDVDNAERGSGYLASAGGGNKQVSARGKALVRALPDRDAVKIALTDHPIRRRKATAKKAAGSNGSSASATHKSPRKTTKRTAPTSSSLTKP